MILRLLADDLTGALDSAARFVPLVGPIPVQWMPTDVGGSAAFDMGTREATPDVARQTAQDWARLLLGADIAFKKIDSLLRGHVDAELSACLPLFDRCVLAPAVPHQGRITRAGRQWARGPDGWNDTGVTPAHPMLDAETDADLLAIVARERAAAGRILWCGTGGLAGALAGGRPIPRPDLPKPVLALIGSNHPVSLRQLARAPDAVTATIPDGTAPRDAQRLIVETFVARLSNGARAGTWVISGGETLRALCLALGARALMVDGEVEPGIPTAILLGGDWDGQRVVSKSGAFGDDLFLARLLGV